MPSTQSHAVAAHGTANLPSPGCSGASMWTSMPTAMHTLIPALTRTYSAETSRAFSFTCSIASSPSSHPIFEPIRYGVPTARFGSQNP